MILALFAAISSASTAPPPAAVVRQARASVTIIAAPVLRFEEIERSAPHLLRETEVRAPDGTSQRARLVEFQ